MEESSIEAGGKTAGLVEQVIDYLRDHVASEQLRPGAKLPSETNISVTLGVSRPVVREAMRTLAATGLVELAVGKRATIVPVDGEMLSRVIGNAVLIGQAEAPDILEMRRGIEITMVALAADRRSESDVAELKAIVQEMATCLADGPRYSHLDLQLHKTLARATANPLYPLLIEALRQLIEVSMLAGIARWATTPALKHVQDLHETIVREVEARNPSGAASAMAQHFDDALATILAPILARADA